MAELFLTREFLLVFLPKVTTLGQRQRMPLPFPASWRKIAVHKRATASRGHTPGKRKTRKDCFVFMKP
jgi:hypothetical protein